MHTLSSAKRTCRASLSAAEWIDTQGMPSSWQARITRRAVSPRLAIRIFLNMSLPEAHLEERLAVLDGLGVLDQAGDDGAIDLGLDLVHELHRLDDAEHLPLLHLLAHLDEGRGVGAGGAIEGAHERRVDR